MVSRIIDLEPEEVVESIDQELSEETFEVPEPVTNESRKASYGRPAGARAWMWDGTETTIVLAWDIHGKTHDGGRRYLQKKHCLCCGISGFREHCVKCRKETCQRCRSGNDKSQIIPAIYLKKADVPFTQELYGTVDCFLPSCTRRDDRGFRNLEEMHMHATGRHTAQWVAHQTAQESRETGQVALLQQQVAALTAAMLQNQVPKQTSSLEELTGQLSGNVISPPLADDQFIRDSLTEPLNKPTPAKKRRTRAKKEPATGTPDAPLYTKGA